MQDEMITIKDLEQQPTIYIDQDGKTVGDSNITEIRLTLFSLYGWKLLSVGSKVERIVGKDFNHDVFPTEMILNPDGSFRTNPFRYASGLWEIDCSFGRMSQMIRSIPEDLLSHCTELEKVNNLFTNCIGLDSIPEGLFENNKYLDSVKGLFRNCMGLKEIPERLFKDKHNLMRADDTFNCCAGLKEIPEDLFSTCYNLVDVSRCFEWCIRLKRVPRKLFYSCRGLREMSRCFAYCIDLVDVPGWITEYPPKDLYLGCRQIKNE